MNHLTCRMLFNLKVHHPHLVKCSSLPHTGRSTSHSERAKLCQALQMLTVKKGRKLHLSLSQCCLIISQCLLLYYFFLVLSNRFLNRLLIKVCKFSSFLIQFYLCLIFDLLVLWSYYKRQVRDRILESTV